MTERGRVEAPILTHALLCTLEPAPVAPVALQPVLCRRFTARNAPAAADLAQVAAHCFPDIDRLECAFCERACEPCTGRLSSRVFRMSRPPRVMAPVPAMRLDACSTLVLEAGGHTFYAFVRRLVLPEGLAVVPRRRGASAQFDTAAKELPAALCVVTEHPWFALWRTVLGWLHARVLACQKASLDAAWSAVTELVLALGCQALPRPGESLRVYTEHAQRTGTTESVRRPADEHRPAGENLAPLLSALTPTKVVLAAAALLRERRVVVVAPDMPALTQSVTALAMLLWPFSWPHRFASVLPCEECERLLGSGELLRAGGDPFLVGVLEYEFELFREQLVGAGVVVVDLGQGSVSCALTEMELLPQTLVFQLRQTLTVAASSLPSSAGLDNEMVYAAFRAFLARTVGHYELFFARELQPGAPATFDEAAFVAAHSIPEQRFLRVFCQTALFRGFVASRLRELEQSNGTMKQTQFDVDVAREVPRESLWFIDALRTPITNHLPVRWQASNNSTHHQQQDCQVEGEEDRTEQEASKQSQQQRQQQQNQQQTSHEEPKEQQHKAGKLLFPEEKPHTRGFFQLHAMFSPDCDFDPDLVAVEQEHIFDDMPALGPLIIQGVQPAPLLPIDDLLRASPQQSHQEPPPPPQQQQQEHEAESQTALDLLTMEPRPSDLLW